MSAQSDFRLRQLEKRLLRNERQLVDAHQRIARTFLPGKVAQVRKAGEDWQVRLELGRNPENGVAILSPWVPVQPVSAGGLKVKVKPTIGERFGLLSPSGTVGSGSWSIRGPFDNDHPAPAGDEDVVLERGRTRLAIREGMVLVTTGDATIEISGDEVRVNGKAIRFGSESLSHNDHNIGSTHRHPGVEPGGAFTLPPPPLEL
ncbi:hypothetical protein [Ancylobacter sp. G4_0304]|uniref:hypothetical protein n=1 Tax=Ancylobacter sp. G4_0304 TaxID=3114289 RepID=UPI0039C5DF04